jgi:drug/metabolite transporter (DMT)-like permease
VGLARVFSANALLVGVGAAAGFGVLALIAPRLGPATTQALTAFSVYFVPALGLAVALADLRRRRSLLVALGAFAVMLLVLDGGPQ